MLNQISLIGNVAKISSSRTGGGKLVVSFTVATNEHWTDGNGERQENAEFHRCVAFQRGDKEGLAGMLANHLRKGNCVFVQGKSVTRSWRKAGEDTDRYQTEVHADTFQFVGPNMDRYELKAAFQTGAK